MRKQLFIGSLYVIDQDAEMAKTGMIKCAGLSLCVFVGEDLEHWAALAIAREGHMAAAHMRALHAGRFLKPGAAQITLGRDDLALKYVAVKIAQFLPILCIEVRMCILHSHCLFPP